MLEDDVETVFQTLQLVRLDAYPSWSCKQKFFFFEKDTYGWSWSVLGPGQKEFPELYAYYRENIDSFQTENFKTRKDAVAYVESFAGKNTQFGFCFKQLRKPHNSTWVIGTTNWSIFKKEFWIAADKESYAHFSKSPEGKPFYTRKQAIAFLLKQGFIKP